MTVVIVPCELNFRSDFIHLIQVYTLFTIMPDTLPGSVVFILIVVCILTVHINCKGLTVP